MEKAFKKVLLFLVATYRTVGTTHMGGACRYYPSCSEYAVEALHKHNSFYAVKLIFKRVISCRPGGGQGYDPVPQCCGEHHG